ncbi:MAG: ROK family protein [Clostridia bacterium]|nr:ROK family protein [Clostridia bacterium]
MYYFGIDLGGTNIAAGIVDENYNIIAKGSTPTIPSRPTDEIVADMAALCKKIAEGAGIPLSAIEACGIASPGTANSDTGVVEYANNIPMLYYPMTKKLSEFLGIGKVYLDNDANAAALAEALAGSAKGASSAIMITLGTGVGGGIIINGKIYSGFNHAGAELGHIVIEKDGKPCTCGRKGCWEAYSSATGLINMTKEKMLSDRNTVMWKMCDNNIDKVSGRTAFNAMKHYKDKAATEVCDRYISYLACGIANIMNIFQPEVISIGGGVSNEGDPLFVPLREKAYKEDYAKNSANHPKIVRATLGNDAGIIGAAALGMDRG